MAFGMDQAGNPKGANFTKYMDAAIFWQILEKDKAFSKTDARDTALIINQNISSCPLSESDVRKAKAKLPTLDGSNPVINAFIKMIIEDKYGLSAQTGGLAPA